MKSVTEVRFSQSNQLQSHQLQLRQLQSNQFSVTPVLVTSSSDLPASVRLTFSHSSPGDTSLCQNSFGHAGFSQTTFSCVGFSETPPSSSARSWKCEDHSTCEIFACARRGSVSTMGDRFKVLRVYFSMQLSPNKMAALAEDEVFDFSPISLSKVRRMMTHT